jgi:pilus assembly protein CpaB
MMDRQKILLIFGAAWVSAVLLTWFLWSRTKVPRTEKTIGIVAVSRDLPAGSKLQSNDIKLVNVPEKDVPRSAVADVKIAEGRVLLYPLNANEPVTSNKLASSSGAEGLPATIEPGMRALSVPITDITGVAGLLQPRAHVDVLFTRVGTMAEALTTTILEDVVVLSIGRTTEVQSSATAAGGSPSAPPVPTGQTRAVTLLVTPEDARKLELAKNQGRLSMALRNPLDKSRLSNKQGVTAEAIDPYLFVRASRPAPVSGASQHDARDWTLLNGDAPMPPPKPQKKEPPKPRLVVDVFRGDKHSQESFQ